MEALSKFTSLNICVRWIVYEEMTLILNFVQPGELFCQPGGILCQPGMLLCQPERLLCQPGNVMGHVSSITRKFFWKMANKKVDAPHLGSVNC